MAKDRACKGVIEIGPAPEVIAHVTDWEVDQGTDPIDVSEMGNCTFEELPGIERGRINVTCWFSNSQDAGQALVQIGAGPTAIALFPFGKTTGLPQFTATVNVTNKVHSANVAGSPQLRFESSADNNGVTEGVVP